jgi:hypothetical protein
MDEDMMGYMDEDIMVDESVDYMDEDMMGYMDEDIMVDESMMGYMAEGPMTEDPHVPAGAEEDITQDYLDDVLETRENPNKIVTEPTIQDAAPGGYVARMMRASKRLDRLAAYCEKEGYMKLAYRLDSYADAIDARIKKEARNV